MDEDNELSIVPIKYFANPHSSVLIPHIVETISIHNIYHPAHCAGILDVYSVDSVNNQLQTKTNVLIESIKNRHHRNLHWIFNNFLINGQTLVESNTLKTLYNADNEEALQHMSNRDASILCRAINGSHPIQYLCQKFETIKVSNGTTSFIKSFDFIMSYISMSLSHYPRESGFVFVNAHTGVPILMRIMRHHAKLAMNGEMSTSRQGIQKVIDVFNAVDDPTGFFHHLLLYICPDFPLFVQHIQNKGRYTYFDNYGRPITLMKCYLERRLDVWANHDLKDLDTLYAITRNWPESIIEISQIS